MAASLIHLLDVLLLIVALKRGVLDLRNGARDRYTMDLSLVLLYMENNKLMVGMSIYWYDFKYSGSPEI